jgi:hypothetical protein
MNRRLPLLLVSAVVVLCFVGAIVAGVAAGSGFSPVAYQVNGHQVSQATVDNELSWLVSSPVVKNNVKQQGQVLSRTHGSINANFSANWLTERIQITLMRQEAVRRKVRVTAAARAGERKVLARQFKGAPDSLLSTLVDSSLYIRALGFSSQDEVNSFVATAFKKNDVRVDPRYGTWHPTAGVCPPSGCASAAASAGG